MDVGAVKAPTNSKEPTMQTITTIGLDIANRFFRSMALTLKAI